MFGKKKKRLEISAPSNFEHRVHTGFDPREQKFTGLPQQWQSLLADTANRPKPMVDPSYITPIQLAPMKVTEQETRSLGRSNGSCCGCRGLGYSCSQAEGLVMAGGQGTTGIKAGASSRTGELREARRWQLRPELRQVVGAVMTEEAVVFKPQAQTIRKQLQ
eukprot:superscaffoldBa00005919_g20935